MAGMPQIPGYTRLVEIGRGGQAVVYRAEQTKLGRTVAVKVLKPMSSDAVLRQFHREGNAMIELGQHPHLVQVFDVDMTPEGEPYLVMEYCSQGSCADRLNSQGPFEVGEALSVGRAVADALHAIHSRQMLHRDIKPANILLSDWGPRLADLGIARHQDLGYTTTASSLTVPYAAPELLNGDLPSVASDLWALGATLHCLLDGRSPFVDAESGQSGAMGRLITRVQETDPNPIARDDLPVDFEAAIAWLLQKDPADRPASARDVWEVLDEIGRNLPAVSAGHSETTESKPDVVENVDPPTVIRRVDREPAKEAVTSLNVDGALVRSSTDKLEQSSLRVVGRGDLSESNSHVNSGLAAIPLIQVSRPSPDDEQGSPRARRIWTTILVIAMAMGAAISLTIAVDNAEDKYPGHFAGSWIMPVANPGELLEGLWISGEGGELEFSIICQDVPERSCSIEVLVAGVSTDLRGPILGLSDQPVAEIIQGEVSCADGSRLDLLTRLELTPIDIRYSTYLDRWVASILQITFSGSTCPEDAAHAANGDLAEWQNRHRFERAP